MQIREKDLAARNLTDLTRAAIAASERAAAARARILVNDRLDVAWAAAAAGVHAGESSLPIRALAEARRELGREDFLLGASCHSLQGSRRRRGGRRRLCFLRAGVCDPVESQLWRSAGINKIGRGLRSRFDTGDRDRGNYGGKRRFLPRGGRRGSRGDSPLSAERRSGGNRRAPARPLISRRRATGRRSMRSLRARSLQSAACPPRHAALP